MNSLQHECRCYSVYMARSPWWCYHRDVWIFTKVCSPVRPVYIPTLDYPYLRSSSAKISTQGGQLPPVLSVDCQLRYLLSTDFSSLYVLRFTVWIQSIFGWPVFLFPFGGIHLTAAFVIDSGPTSIKTCPVHHILLLLSSFGPTSRHSPLSDDVFHLFLWGALPFIIFSFEILSFHENLAEPPMMRCLQFLSGCLFHRPCFCLI